VLFRPWQIWAKLLLLACAWLLLVYFAQVIPATRSILSGSSYAAVEKRFRHEEPLSAAQLQAPNRREIWRSTRVCGVNCLYILLRISGKDVDYSQLCDSSLTDTKYNSLAELAESAQGYDLRVQCYQLSPDQLRRSPMPLIAHLDQQSVKGQTRGHFILVLATSTNRVTYVDGTTAQIKSVDWAKFQKEWSGSALVLIPDNPLVTCQTFVVLNSLVLALGVVVEKKIIGPMVKRARPKPNQGTYHSGANCAESAP
jgi:hypothetical protein